MPAFTRQGDRESLTPTLCLKHPVNKPKTNKIHDTWPEMDLKEELTSLHTGLWGNITNITTGDFDKKNTHTQK